jgi:hypothetical protein
MDALASVLDGPRARGAFLIRSVMEPPWSVRVQDEAPLTLVAILRGDAWLVLDGRRRSGRATRLQRGDIAIVRGPNPYTMADDPATPPHAVIHPGQRCTTPQGDDVPHEMELGVRTWGNNPDGSTEFLVGTYRMQGEISQRLLDALPGHLVLPEALELLCVTGPGGTLGSEVVRQLQSINSPFRAAYFSSQQADAARTKGIDAVVCDYNRPETLRAAFQGCDRLFSSARTRSIRRNSSCMPSKQPRRLACGTS